MFRAELAKDVGPLWTWLTSDRAVHSLRSTMMNRSALSRRALAIQRQLVAVLRTVIATASVHLFFLERYCLSDLVGGTGG